MRNVNDVVQEEKCTGCGACSAACPKNCIEMKTDREGFYAPSVDRAACVDCGLCMKVCHTISRTPGSGIRNGAAFSSLDKAVYETSASGGAFAELAKTFIARYNGYVCGAAMGSDGSVKHRFIRSAERLPELQNSKYTESYTADAFMECKRLLNAGEYVLFSGTGCQISALKTFLGSAQERLFTVDLVCHGVPASVFLKKHLKAYIDQGYTDFAFRVKGRGEVSAYGLGMKKDAAKTKFIDAEKDSYMNLFVNGISLRESCYRCDYANANRYGDLTLGDLPRACIIGKDVSEMTGFTGVLVNSERGEVLFEHLKAAHAEMHEIDLPKYIRLNARLRAPGKRPAERDTVYSELMREPYSEDRIKTLMVRRPLSQRIKKRISACVPVSVKKIIKEIKRK